MLDLEFEACVIGSLTNNAYNAKVDQLSARVATRKQRLAILDAAETETKAELIKLDKVNATLAKTLGRPRHELP